MSPFVRDVGLVARFELGEAIRSRMLVVMTLLFVGAGALGAWGFTEVLGTVEENAAKVMGNAPPPSRGSTLKQMTRSRSYRDMLRVFTRDDKKADYFASLPPIVVFFGWASFTFVPWLVLLTASESIAGEVATRSIRFSVVRTGRLPFALGKMVGQAVVVAGMMVLTAATFFVVAWIRLAGFEPGATALGLFSYAPRVLLYVMPFLAWAMFASMITGNPQVARSISLGGAVALNILRGLGKIPALQGPALDPIWDFLKLLTPFGHNEGLLYPPGGALMADVAVCLMLTVLYFGGGFAMLRRRDL